jgi:hypothetical protein
MVRAEFQGAFEHCSWCGGRGCNQCTYERQKWIEANYGPDGLPKPIFEANPDNPEDMELLKFVVGREALEHAFGPGGGGMQEIHERAAEASILQLLRKLGGPGPEAGTADEARASEDEKEGEP